MNSGRRYYSLPVILMLLTIGGVHSLFAAGATDGKAVSTGMNPSVAVPAGPFGMYEPAITVTSVRYIPPIAAYRPGDDINVNVWTREIEEKLGIKVKYDWVIEQNQYQNKLNLTLASGDLPDFFSCDAGTYVKLAKAGQLADITQAYENFASPDLKGAMDAFPAGFNSGKLDGKLYALSAQYYGLPGLMDAIWIRSDWLAKYKLDPPKSLADVEKIALTFMKGESAANKAVFGISLNRDLYSVVSNMVGISNAHGGYPGIWIKDAKGNIVYGSVQGEMKKALETLARWYKMGLLSQEFGVKDIDASNADLVSGRVGISFGAQWNGWYPFNDLVKKDPTAIFRPYTIPSLDGKPAKLQAPWPVATYWVVGKKAKNPEAIMKMANLYVKYQFHGTEAEFKNFSDGGEYAVQRQLCPIDPVIDPRSEDVMSQGVAQALATGDTSKFGVAAKVFYENCLLWTEKQNADGFGRYSQQGPEGSYVAIRKNIAMGVQFTELQGADTPIWAKNRAILDKLEKDTFTKIILGGASIDDFDTFVANWRKLGGDAATQEINDTYNKK